MLFGADTQFLIAITTILILAYFVFVNSKTNPKTDLSTNTKTDYYFLPKKIKIYTYQDNDDDEVQNYFMTLNQAERIFYLSKNPDLAEVFTIEYIKRPEYSNLDYPEIIKILEKEPDRKIFFKNKISLRTKDNYYVGLNYSNNSKERYEVVAKERVVGNSNILKLNSRNDMFYIRFFNTYHLNNKNGEIFANKTNYYRFPFKISKVETPKL